MDWVYEDIEELVTPVGVFRVSDGVGNVRFSVERNRVNNPSTVMDENNNEIGTISTETNYRIVIRTSSLETGREYVISFSAGNWEFCSSDEHTTCYSTVIGEWVVGIGAFDPNDQEKDYKTLKNAREKGYQSGLMPTLEAYDENRFEKYTVEPLNEFNGYTFKLFDKTAETVTFEVAWIRIGEFPTVEYESALGFWLC